MVKPDHMIPYITWSDEDLEIHIKSLNSQSGRKFVWEPDEIMDQL